MMRTAIALLATGSQAFAEGFDRPVPNPQSATAEFWFAFACVAFVAALYAVHRLVSRR